jgi:plasmid stabilization system protein ParE
VVARLQRAFEMLTRVPKAGHRRAGLDTSEPVLLWPVGSYVVVYKPTKPLIIVRVLHGARDFNALL